jgi:hypothetical protein
MKAQNAANNHNRYQTLENSSISQLQPNPQATHYDADVVNDYNAGSQAYYFKGVPDTTVISPVIFPPIAPIAPILPPPPINAINEFINTQNPEGIQSYINTYGTAISLIEFRSSLKNGYTDSQRGSTLSVVLAYSNNGTTTIIPYTSPTYIQDFISTFDSVNTDNPPNPNLPIYAVVPIYTTSGSPYTATIDLTAPAYNGQSYASIIQNNIATLVFEIPISVTGALYELTLTYTMGSFIKLRYNGTTLIDQNGTNYTANNSLTVGTLSIPLIGLGSFGGSANGGGTPLPVPIVPGPPTITGLIPGNQTLLVNYDEGTPGFNPIINYAYSLSGSLGTFTPFDPPQTTSILTITGLTNNTSYTIAIKAISQDGSGESSNDVSGIPSANPPPPQILSVISSSPVGSSLGQLTVYFSQSPYYPSITNYRYSTNGITSSLFSPAQANSPVTITGLTLNTPVYVILNAYVNSTTSSAISNSVYVTPVTSSTTIHSFFETTSWTAPSGISSVSALVMGGGGGGGGGYDNAGGGGGGAGLVLTDSSYSVNQNETYSITIGTGGSGGQGRSSAYPPLINTPGSSGLPSSFGSIIAIGGGGGSSSRVGGGSSVGTQASSSLNTGGGGGGGGAGGSGGAGGGGNGSAGTAGSSVSGGSGGSSLSSSISGNAVSYGAGGSGGSRNFISAGTSGDNNTGNGGGGISAISGSPLSLLTAGNGGSGIVILRY